MCLTSIETFRFDGETAEGLKISAEQCAVYSTEIRELGPVL